MYIYLVYATCICINLGKYINLVLLLSFHWTPPSISINPHFFSRDLSFQLPLPALGGRVLSVSIPKLGRFLQCRIVGLSQTKTDCSNKKKLHHPHRWPPKLFAKLFVYDAEVNAKYVLRSAVPRGENWVQIPLGRSPGLDILRSSSKPVHWCNFLLGRNWKREKKEQKACHSHLCSRPLCRSLRLLQGHDGLS